MGSEMCIRDSDWTYGNIAIISALDYASYRAGHFDWKAAAPQLAAWHASLAETSVWSETYEYDAAAS